MLSRTAIMHDSRKQYWLCLDGWTEDQVVHLLYGREPLTPFLGDMPEDWLLWLDEAAGALRVAAETGRLSVKHGFFNPSEVVRWADARREVWPAFPLTVGDLVPAAEIRQPKGVAKQQMEAILNALTACGYKPTALPPRPKHGPWVVAQIRPMLVPKVMQNSAFEKRWQDLRDEGLIAEVNDDSPLRIPQKRGMGEV